jgi:hypothetical protein
MSRKREPEAELTARPKSSVEQLTTRPVAEEGLSVDAEDLGKQFLADATEQDNYESSLGGDTTEIELLGAPPSDEALIGPDFEADHDVWENTIDISLQSGGTEDALEDASPEGTEQNQGISANSGEVDLTGESRADGSLFDREEDGPGEVKTPRTRAGDARRRFAGRRTV